MRLSARAAALLILKLRSLQTIGVWHLRKAESAFATFGDGCDRATIGREMGRATKHPPILG